MLHKLWKKTAALLCALLVAGLASANPIVAHGAMQMQGLETAGVFRIGMEANYAPFNWTQTTNKDGAVEIVNSPGEYANGYDVQVAKRLAEQMNLKLEIVKSEWDGLPPAVMSGKIDAIIAGMSPTAERKQQIDFSDKYYTSDLVLVVKKDSAWSDKKNMTDFAGARVTGQLNTFHYTVIDQIPGVVKEVAMDNFPAMITAVSSEKIDAYVSERPGAMAAVAANPDLTFVAFDAGTGFDVSSEDTSIAVGLRKDSPLTPEINRILSDFSESERTAIMQQAVDLNVRGESVGFFASVGNLLNDYGSSFIKGTITTLLIAVISTLVGFLIGLAVAVIRSIPVRKEHNALGYGLHRVVDFLLTAYIEIFRGTPMMVQAMMIFYGSKLFFNIDMSSLVAAFFIVSINTGAYLAEIVRGGIDSIDKGQSEAAKAIGMTHAQTMVKVVLPQAIRNILPALGNEFVINIKDTSVLNVIAVTELFFVTKSAAGSTYLIFQSFFIASVIYFFLTFTITRILRQLEKRMDGPANFVVLQNTKGDL